jgi:hypothetical protein
MDTIDSIEDGGAIQRVSVAVGHTTPTDNKDQGETRTSRERRSYGFAPIIRMGFR